MNLVAHGVISSLSVPFANNDRALLNTDFNTNSATGELHFTQVQDGTPVSYLVSNFTVSSLTPAYAGYQRANVTLTGFTSGTNTDPQAFAFGTMIVNGVTNGDVQSDTVTLRSGNVTATIRFDGTNFIFSHPVQGPDFTETDN